MPGRPWPRRLEGTPSDEQKHRLEAWLTELKLICGKYQLLLDTDYEDVRIVDLQANTVIGFGVTYLTEDRGDQEVITAYDCRDSVLDGVWVVDTHTGPAEQRTVGRVFPAPEAPFD